jgi:hypothetical protein
LKIKPYVRETEGEKGRRREGWKVKEAASRYLHIHTFKERGEGERGKGGQGGERKGERERKGRTEGERRRGEQREREEKEMG